MKHLTPNTEYDSIAFSGCGLLLPYHFGVVKCLNDNNITFQKASGVSAGTFGAGAILNLAHLDLGIRQSYDLMVESTIGPFGNILCKIEHFFDCFAKNDAWKKSKNRWFIACGTGIIPKSLLCNDFENPEEFSNCALGGCWFPGVFGFKIRRYRNHILYDHGIISGAYLFNYESVLVSLLTSKSMMNKKLSDILIEADQSSFPPFTWMKGDKKNPQTFHRDVYIKGYQTCQNMIKTTSKRPLIDVLAEYQIIMDRLENWREMKWG